MFQVIRWQQTKSLIHYTPHTGPSAPSQPIALAAICFMWIEAFFVECVDKIEILFGATHAPGRSDERSFSMVFIGRHTLPRVCISISSKTNDRAAREFRLSYHWGVYCGHAHTHACTVWRGEQATHSDCFTSWKNDHGGQSTDNYRCNNIWYILTWTRAWARGCGWTVTLDSHQTVWALERLGLEAFYWRSQ